MCQGLCTLFLAFLVGGAFPTAAPPGPIMQQQARTVDSLRPSSVLAGRYLAPDGTLQPGVGLVLREGKIASLVPATELEGQSGVVRWPKAVVSPGAVGLLSSLGAYDRAGESAYAIDPGVSVSDALDLKHPDFRRACEAGITTAVITPVARNVICGAAAVVKTAGPAGNPAVLRSDGPLVIALGPSVLEAEREPTSRMGAVALLRNTLEDAAEGRGHERLRDFAAGKLDAIAVCGEPPDVSAALRTFAVATARVVLAYNGDEHSLVEEFAAEKRAAILGPLSFNSSRRTLTLPGEMIKAGVPVAFAAPMPEQPFEGLRLTAALAVRYGMDPAAARRAITTQAAETAGVPGRVGSIRPGADADLVIYSDDPLRLDSRILEVYVDGSLVYSAQAERQAQGHTDEPN